MMTRFTAAATALALAATPAAAQANIEGHWTNPKRTTLVRVERCDGKAYCAVVLKASAKAQANARKGGTDPLVGTQLLRRITPKSEGRWTAQLFVPDINKTSNVELRQLELNQLKVTGCAVGRLLCRSQIWVRVESE